MYNCQFAHSAIIILSESANVFSEKKVIRTVKKKIWTRS